MLTIQHTKYWNLLKLATVVQSHVLVETGRKEGWIIKNKKKKQDVKLFVRDAQ